jgi:hypothetical protein
MKDSLNERKTSAMHLKIKTLFIIINPRVDSGKQTFMRT